MTKLNKKQTKLKHDGIKYRAVPDNGGGCTGCEFQFKLCPAIPISGEDSTSAHCRPNSRKDKEGIIWVKKEQAE